MVHYIGLDVSLKQTSICTRGPRCTYLLADVAFWQIVFSNSGLWWLAVARIETLCPSIFDCDILTLGWPSRAVPPTVTAGKSGEATQPVSVSNPSRRFGS
jgi:hypothetical protein